MATTWPGCTLAPKPTISSAKRSISSSVTGGLWTGPDVDEGIVAGEGAAAGLEAAALVDPHAVGGEAGPRAPVQVPPDPAAPAPGPRVLVGLGLQRAAAHVGVAHDAAVRLTGAHPVGRSVIALERPRHGPVQRPLAGADVVALAAAGHRHRDGDHHRHAGPAPHRNGTTRVRTTNRLNPAATAGSARVRATAASGTSHTMYQASSHEVQASSAAVAQPAHSATPGAPATPAAAARPARRRR